MYTGSLYASLASLIDAVDSNTLQGKRVAMFAFGGGAAASFFALRIARSTSFMADKMDLRKRLGEMRVATCEEYDAAMKVRLLHL